MLCSGRASDDKRKTLSSLQVAPKICKKDVIGISVTFFPGKFLLEGHCPLP